MRNWLVKNRSDLAVLFVAAIILLPFLGAAPLTDPDEAVYGQTAREMMLAGDWLSPRIFGNFWYDKPPLFYWMEMVSYTLLGISDWSSRLPSALLAWGTVVYLYIQARNIFNKPIAAVSALILSTSVGFMYVGKAAVTDMTLLFTLTVVMVSFYRKHYYWAYAFCGLALLAKGPVGYAFPALIMLLYIGLTRQWTLLKTMKIPQGILVAFLIGLPWYVLMYQTHGSAFLDTFIGYHNITRFAAPEHPGQNSLFFFVPILFAAMIPWTAALIPAVCQAVKQKDSFRNARLFCLIWAAFIFIFFSLSKTQLVTYIAPMFPPVSLLIGAYLYQLWQQRRMSAVVLCSAYGLAAAVLLCNFIPLNEGAQFFQPAIRWSSLLLGAAFFLPAILWQQRRPMQALCTALAAMTVFSWAAFGWIIPSLSSHTTSFEAAYVLHDVYDGRSPLYIEKFLRPGLAYYSGLYGQEWTKEKQPDFAAILHHPDKTYIVMTRSTYQQLCRSVPELLQYGIAAELPAHLILINHP
ncbi:glycosyltransferase family 39 protein [uncultured Megasphaera sp.]|uniref:ArnT family glycosyltransferase n=1 Tax=uncultured Megasphaera sp. TaxID=165188 RepID=UPI00265A14FD|nr:glycosyltransferase family 39 protein [uncultured Megasphaera sp.]